MSRILDFIKSATNLVPATRALDLWRDAFEEAADAMTRGSAASALAAAERGALLWSDDLSLRSVAANEWGAQGVSTPAVLQELRDRGMLSDADYGAAVRTLIAAGYTFISLTWKDLVATLAAGEWRRTAEVQAVFDALAGPNCSEASAVIVLATFIQQLWIGPYLPMHRMLGLSLTLDAIVAGRHRERALGLLRRAIRARFALCRTHTFRKSSAAS